MSLFAKLSAMVTGVVTSFTADAADACMGGMLLVGAADGDLDSKEFDKACDMAKINTAFEGHDVDKIAGSWEKKIDTSFRAARRDFFAQCKALKNNEEQAQNILLGMLEVGDASTGSAEGEAKEDAFIEQTAEELGLTSWLAKNK